ncbi:hypothetical protein HOP54_02480 [Halomonas daqingensis]|uniref:hypothetical protein n=1 Tax=Billgrantia desiderata TaxID=52021 RepID=UPI001F1EC931|nr:hypothetical protein [Halomonas desiderata]MCE8027556.1 hypothetical protein [Halomonas desiderata]
MLDTTYLKDLLQTIGNSRYEGIDTGKLVDASLGQDFDDADFLKFKYHMDEMWQAGLVRGRDGPGKNGWGYQGSAPRIMLVPIPLVLSPVGSELLAELQKPKGLERFKQAIRSVGATAGTEALKYGIGELLERTA